MNTLCSSGYCHCSKRFPPCSAEAPKIPGVGQNMSVKCCTFFWASCGTKCPGDQILIVHGALMIGKKEPDMQETKSVVMNKTWKVEVHITDDQSWNSSHGKSEKHRDRHTYTDTWTYIHTLYYAHTCTHAHDSAINNKNTAKINQDDTWCSWSKCLQKRVF